MAAVDMAAARRMSFFLRIRVARAESAAADLNVTQQQSPRLEEMTLSSA
ncbi:MAG: hypothetical protein ACTS6J_08805 [Burkholderiales bacterium]